MRRSVEIAETRGLKRTQFLMLMSILYFNSSKKKKKSLFYLYLELVPAREDRLREAGKKKDVPGFLKGVPCFLGGVPGFLGLLRVFRGCSRFCGCSRMFRDVLVFQCSVFRCCWKYYMPLATDSTRLVVKFLPP